MQGHVLTAPDWATASWATEALTRSGAPRALFLKLVNTDTGDGEYFSGRAVVEAR